MGEQANLADVAVVGVAGEVVGKGTEVGVNRWQGGDGDGSTPRGGVGGGEGSCWSYRRRYGFMREGFYSFQL
jgi:hypothetical protein